MWRVMGSSPERVRITDLSDVIYYRQVKDYSDQDYENSKDLRKAIQKGKVTVVEHSATPKSVGHPSSPAMTVNNMAPGMDVETLKQAMREVLPEMPQQGSVKDSLRDVIPTIVDMVRQEVSSALSGIGVVSRNGGESSSVPAFAGPEYIPDVTSDGMTSNIEIESKEVSGEGVASNLELLRKLKKERS